MFTVYTFNVDSIEHGCSAENLFDLDFPFWFYTLVILAGLLLSPWFHVIICIVYKTISMTASTLNLNAIHDNRSSKQKMLDLNSTLITENASHSIGPRKAIHSEYRSVCTAVNSILISI